MPPKPHLRACPACARHVRVSELDCPFCAAPLTPAFRAAPAPRPPAARLTRAALLAFGTGALVGPTMTACNSSSALVTQTAQDAGHGISAFEDGGPELEDASPEMPEAMYGAPPISVEEDAGPPDASSDAPSDDASQTADASDAAPVDGGHD